MTKPRRTLDQELAELEALDPKVAAAARRLDEFMDRMAFLHEMRKYGWPQEGEKR